MVPISRDDYDVIRQIYKSSKTTVWLIYHKGAKQEVVLKRYRRSALDADEECMVRREIEIHSVVRHPNIALLLGHWTTDNSHYLVIEYARGGDLFDVIYKRQSPLDNQRIGQCILPQLIDAVKYLHEHDITHGDIKPENIGVREDGSIMLLDFGLCLSCSETMCKARCKVLFTKDYASPELIQNTDVFWNNPKAFDIWCIGLLVYEMFTRSSPKRAWKKPLNVDHRQCPFAHIIKRCTTTDPCARPSADDLVQMLAACSTHVMSLSGLARSFAGH